MYTNKTSLARRGRCARRSRCGCRCRCRCAAALLLGCADEAVGGIVSLLLNAREREGLGCLERFEEAHLAVVNGPESVAVEKNSQR